MEILQATPQDLPEIIGLLKMSLGESLIPKSEAYFSWKHSLNPFGKSYICVAKEADQLIGLRTFMRWKWRLGDKEFSAVRAVDTATHPDHQGKGIFKKLTLQAVEACKKEGVDFVFNSPNNQSKPGYLKMGWKDIGRMPVLLKPGSIFPAKYSEEKLNSIYETYSFHRFTQISSENSTFPVNPMFLHTPLSLPYLLWRYSTCPVAKYGILEESEKFGIIFRLKASINFTELRICELWTMNKEGEKLAKQALRKLIREVSPLFVSCAPSPLSKAKLGFFGPFSQGPVTTVRSLCMEDLKVFERFNQWRPSMGSMELF